MTLLLIVLLRRMRMRVACGAQANAHAAHDDRSAYDDPAADVDGSGANDICFSWCSHVSRYPCCSMLIWMALELALLVVLLMIVAA